MRMPRLPFAHLNLRRNPFGEIPREERGELVVGTLDREIDHLHSGGIVEFCGESGRGKSSALYGLHEHLEGAAYQYVPHDERLTSWPEADVLLVDEVQFLERATRLELWNRALPIACGTHVSYADEMRARSRDVLEVDLDAPRDLDELEAIFHRRIEAHRRNDGPVPELERETLRALRERYGSDHRAMERHLYEIVQTLDEPRAIVPRDLEDVDLPDPTPVPPTEA